ncbi:N-formylglutamate amidohydrolase [Asticcacaulis sp. EMRT-3]|uniref:N-formylglutamate amidohydrolase n=1 Tax=Asticcacaulis sp. EMRT-3 TaxID=3040349 RepID=UPI0024AF252C|nr:N-formylglutamate amidohydrolase [Asticcacaulis sp. EMRT-3]MDI7773731.1 N-formylglutamate amidohydrolase [Asticcacaulis sp. EMRT-3]
MNAPSPQLWQVVHRPDDAVAIARPEQPCRIVYSLPHSGRYYPDSFIASAQASGPALRASEDAFVDAMVSPQALGVHGVTGLYARAFCDVNRHPLELDARLIRGRLPRAALSLSARVKAGYGVIARRLSADQEIYRQPLDMDEVNLRLDLIHRPYHEALLGRLLAARQSARAVLLIDWHSMPSAALSYLAAHEARPDIVLGNRYGESCGEGLVRQVRGFLEGRGLRVGLNKPFAGGYIVEHYGRPSAGVEALQIEINRAIYMDEAALQPHAGAERLKAIFAEMTAMLLSS